MVRFPGRHLAQAWRTLSRNRMLTVTILATFTLGLGANTALFISVDRLFFQAPPGLAAPSEVRRLLTFSLGGGAREYADNTFYEDQPERLAAAVGDLATLSGYGLDTDTPIGEEKEKRVAAYAMPGFFRFAGVAAYRGRLFAEEENRNDGFEAVVLLSHSYWRRRFGGADAALGSKLRVDSALFTVIGVLPPRFDGLDLDAVDIWVPRRAHPAGGEGQWTATELFARLSNGVSPRAVEARLTTAYREFDPERLKLSPRLRIELAPVLAARSPLGIGGYLGPRMISLVARLAVVALIVLVIATSNVASLLLMNAIRRRREIAIRVALGASAGRLLRSLVAESVTLAISGGAVALLIASWSGGALRRILLPQVRWSTSVIDGRTIVFTIALAIVAGVVAGTAPASIALRRDLTDALRSGSAESGRPRSAMRTALLVTQTALCLMMLAAAGIFVESLRNANRSARGFDTDRLITFDLFWIPQTTVTDAVSRISGLPGVVAVSQSTDGVRPAGSAPVFFSNGDSTRWLDGPFMSYVDSAFARTVGVRIVAGRFISAIDTKATEPVIVVNEAFARLYWPGRDPIGDCIRVGTRRQPCRRIVGVIANVRWFLTEPAPRAIYMPLTQAPWPGQAIVVRTQGPAKLATVADVHRLVAPLGGSSAFPPTPMRLMDRLEPSMRPWRIAAATFLSFGVLALAVAGAGIYGLVGYDVTQRTREFGVRITLGATAASILTLVLSSGARIVGLGLVVGTIVAIGVGRLMASLLFETSPYDPIVLLAAAAILGSAALVASLVPAIRAVRTNPMVALRAE
ncbi:MAG TPA: ABC transporter permease [Gemmatimonadaceae bacterium]|nr:ABC transporter permease [Gemmatimonadaceae bacterium]